MQINNYGAYTSSLQFRTAMSKPFAAKASGVARGLFLF